MSSTAIVDCRRTDLRSNVLYNPYWISSKQLFVMGHTFSALDVMPALEDKAAICFSFPTAGKITRVLDVALQVIDVCAVGAGTGLLTVGLCTLATDAAVTTDNSTDVAADAYMLTKDVTIGTAGYYTALSASSLSAWLTSEITTRTYNAYSYITGAATAVPAVAVYFSDAGGAYTAGSVRLHMLVSDIPGK